jgi:type IX secretion system PorP/SprF family membrane protein
MYGLHLYAQDVHFTMASFAPYHLNPALTGIYEHDRINMDFRVAGTYRNQWRSIRSPYVQSPTPYSTYSLGSDFRLRWLRLLKYNHLGLGSILYRDRSGDLNFGTTQVAYSLSFIKTIGKARRDFLSFGFQHALVRRGIDFSNAYFDNQWTGKSFDPTLGSGENLPSPVFYYQDMNAGILYNHRSQKRVRWTVGAAIFHFNRPRQSFYAGNFEVLLKQKFVLHTTARIPMGETFFLYPVAIYMKQGQANEANVMLYGGKKINNHDVQARLGTGYRLVGSLHRNISSDAMLLALWFIWYDWDIGFSYDTNFSGLTSATSLRGAAEIFITWHRQLQRHKSKYHKFRNKLPECPDDIMLNK